MKHHGERDFSQRCSCGGPHLTGREVQVLLQLALGFSSNTIASNLCISQRTVEDHLAVMRKRAGAHGSVELVARCYAAEILLPGWPPRWSGRSCLTILHPHGE